MGPKTLVLFFHPEAVGSQIARLLLLRVSKILGVEIPIVSIVVPFYGLTKYIIRIL